MDDDFFGRRFGPGPGRGAFHSDFDSFFFGDFNRIFQGMDDMMRQFTLGNFSMIEGPNQAPPAIEAPSNPKNLRDNFLKDHPNNPEHEKSSSSFIFPNHPVQDRFGNHSHPSKYDEDLDVKIEREGLDKVLREDLFRGGNHHHNHNYHHHQYHHQPHHPHPHHHHHQRAFNAPQFDTTPGFFGGGQACSIRRIQRPDGSIEEVKTVRGTDGKEEKTVTRIIGDKAHSVIEKKANNQVQETEEIFHNFDEDKLDEFNKMWNNFPSPSPTDKAQKPSSNGPIMAIKDKEIEKPTPLPIESNVSVKAPEKSPSIFSKIMSWLKK